MDEHILTIELPHRYNQEKQLEDEIFRHPTNIRERNENNGVYDYTLQCFLSRPNDFAYILHPSNIVTNIRNEPGIERFGMDNRIGKDEHRDSYHGVYIVENFIIHRRSADNAITVLNYIKNNANIDITADEKARLIRHMEDSNRTADTVKIRVIRVVPEAILNKYISVYIKRLNLVITKLSPTKANEKALIHPSSYLGETMRKCDNIVNMEDTNLIAIDIINNDNPGKPYYIKIGSEPLRLISRGDSLEPDGYNFIIKNKGVIVTEKDGILAQLNAAGVYESEDEAIYNGNPKLKLEVEKLSHDIDKLRAEKDKTIQQLELDLLKIDHDKEKISHEKDKMEQEIIQLKDKREHELTKYKHEKEMFELNRVNEETKHQYTMNKMIMETYTYKTKSDIEYKNTALKNTQDNVKQNIELLSKIIVFGGTLIKAFSA